MRIFELSELLLRLSGETFCRTFMPRVALKGGGCGQVGCSIPNRSLVTGWMQGFGKYMISQLILSVKDSRMMSRLRLASLILQRILFPT